MLELFGVFALLASAISTNKLILYILPPLFFVGIRMLLAGFILISYLIYSKQLVSRSVLKKHWFELCIATACTTYAPSLLKAYALQLLPSSKAAFFGTLDPFVTALYAYLLWREKLTIKKTIGMFFGFLGACVLLTSRTCVEEQLRALSFISYPELAALGAVVIGRYGWITVQRLLKNNIFSPVQINSITMVGSGVLSLLSSLCLEKSPELFNPGLYYSKVCSELSLYTFFNKFFYLNNSQVFFFVALIAYTILVGNVISYTLYATVLKRYTATFIALTSFSVPLFVQLYGWLFLQEQLSLYFFVACLLTFIGLILFYQKT
ncbi:DMT family transporter [Candidatus Dependentiae bacterium]|nr:DMT family transporter [Candidatus Dependentiae bacterium]